MRPEYPVKKRSRFNKYVDFPDYSPSELREILLKMADDQGYTLTEGALKAAGSVIRAQYEERLTSFGNARTVRNLLESAISTHASRVSRQKTFSIQDLSTITADDVTLSRHRW